MGTLKGPILFTGSIGDIRCYYDKARKQYTISLKGGQNKTQVMNNPKLERQRETMNEMTVSAKWASMLQKSLHFIDHLHWGYYFPKINAMGKAIISHDYEGIHGYRSLESSKNARLLTTINFNKLHPFDEVFTQPYEISFSEDKRTVTLKILGLIPARHLKWREDYASFHIILVIAQLPDWHWNKERKKHEPVIEDSKLLSKSSCSEWCSGDDKFQDVILESSFDQPALQKPGSTVVVAMGIEFSSTHVAPNTTGTYGIGTMKIVECFVQ